MISSNTEQKQTEESGFQIRAPAINLPKGGGAIRGIGEKFAANPVTGTGSMTVPIATSPGRSGFGPQLSLSYDSGAGNGPFGFGWSLSIPSITRKTDKGLPRYLDASESDVFILSGAEDLVPLLQKDGSRYKDNTTSPGTTIFRYRPRIEGLFARIERWQDHNTGICHWRAMTKDNLTSIYGDTENSRISDPNGEHQIFTWLLSRTYDDKGNLIVYEYKHENNEKVPPVSYEKNRAITANRYLKRISYTFQTPYYPAINPVLPDDWHMQVVFDYGEHDQEFAQFDDDLRYPWTVRPDPFSSYRAGFEVRTYRRCKRVLMFHNFPELGTSPCLVRSTDFAYLEEGIEQPAKSLIASFITSTTQSGYVKQGDEYLKRSLPPLEFSYSQVQISDQVETVDPLSLENLPSGLDGARYQWVDLDGEGLSGILFEQEGAWYYKRNLSPKPEDRNRDGIPEIAATFGPLEIVRSHASLADLSSGEQQLLDLAGDGQVDLVQLAGPLPGFYERTQDGRWETFRSFTDCLNLDWSDPNLRFVDLTGDGHADVLITEDNVFTWYPSFAESGFGPGSTIPKMGDEETGPRLVFADGTHSIYLSDMSGDGLSDLVCIRNGEVCYWPNLGYCHFGAKIAMENAPWFDSQDQFDQRRIRLADIDGSGNTDIIYLGREAVQIFFNRSGNSWSDATELKAFPQVDTLASVMAVDLLGNGTACLVWSSSLPGNGARQMRYIDLMGAGARQKPHLLISVKNNLGAETYITYAPSTRFYLEDKFAGSPWITRLPFPVHVVERVETYDWISRNRFVTRYKYHHGYFDGEEREFRGFGMVEQWDTEEMGTANPESIDREDTNWDAASFVPPVLTRTWFHTGAFAEHGRISRQYADMYYHEGDPSLGEGELSPEKFEFLLLPDTILPENLTPQEAREACRALKGSILRQEVYGLDATEKADRPYTVSERNYTIRLVQSKGRNRHAVFFIHPREQVDYHYERELVEIDGKERADPRVSHAMTLQVDAYGNVQRSAAIVYRRREAPNLQTPGQTNTHITLTASRFANYDSEQDWYRIGLPVETSTFELVKPPEPEITAGLVALFKVEAIDAIVEGLYPSDLLEPDSARCWPYEYWDWRSSPSHAPAETRLRLIERLRTLYYNDDLSGQLELGQVAPHGLPYESYKLAFTNDLLSAVFRRSLHGAEEYLLPDPERVRILAGEGGYILSDDYQRRGWFPANDPVGSWWLPSGQSFYSPIAKNPAPPRLPEPLPQETAYAQSHFYLPRGVRDPFGSLTRLTYDDYNLLLLEAEDALENKTTAGERIYRPDGTNTIESKNDYRLLQPSLMTDPNGNRTDVYCDALGLVVATAAIGKPSERKGDWLNDFTEEDTNPTSGSLQSFIDDPLASAPALIKNASTRILYDLDRFRATQAEYPCQPSAWQPVYAATLARETHASDTLPAKGLKIQVDFSYSDGFGREIQKKVQAEPGPVPLRNVETGQILVDESGHPLMTEDDFETRWVGSGWTVFNNKGKPVRQYEPFFSDTHGFDKDACIGVTPVIFYNPVERVIATLHPNHTYEKVVFSPWQQATYDANDTAAAQGSQTGDPRTDPDIAGFVRGYFAAQPETWQTWYAQRQGGERGAHEQAAARKAAFHTNTPTTTHFDTLGRPFLTITQNRYEREDPGGILVTIEEQPATQVEVDIEGNQRAVSDALGRVVMRYDYDMLGSRTHQISMEAGERWTLNNAAGKPIRAWDSRGFARRITYDALQRPLDLWVSEDGAAEFLAERTTYGESKPDPKATNHRGKTWKVQDGAGLLTSEAYDFKGNLTGSTRQLLQNYKNQVDWNLDPALEEERFTGETKYDALSRPIELVAPHRDAPGANINTIYPTYNEANLLERIEALVNSAVEKTVFVQDIDYNAKGQRERIECGCSAEPDLVGVTTTYQYDPDTFRLSHLQTLRGAERLQDLFYTYDPAGNITTIHDDAQPAIFFRNQVVRACSEYTYDALYRLVAATGREHLGQVGGLPVPTSDTDAPRVGQDQSGSGEAMGRYREMYAYDEAGNFLELRHIGSDPAHPGWTHGYAYEDPSLIEPEQRSNRLTGTTIGADTVHYTYNEHGDMITMPHLPLLEWDFKDQLQASSRQVRADGGLPETTYYVYDASGQRARKVTERQAGPGEMPRRLKERIYLGGFEVYREYNEGGETVTLERETLHVMDNKQRIALVETRTQGMDGSPAQLTRYQLSNHLGSACLELDQQAQIISYEEYYPYGSTSYQAVRGDVEINSKQYRYTGMERDEESGLSYHTARYYILWLGVWANTDPGGLLGGLNLYQYTQNNPLSWRDPSGLDVKIAGTTVSDPQNSRQRPHQVTNEMARTVGERDIFMGMPSDEADLFVVCESGIVSLRNQEEMTRARYDRLSEQGRILVNLIRDSSQLYVVHPLPVEDTGTPRWIQQRILSSEGDFSLRVTSGETAGESYDLDIREGLSVVGGHSAAGLILVSPERDMRGRRTGQPSSATSRIAGETHIYYVTGAYNDRISTEILRRGLLPPSGIQSMQEARSGTVWHELGGHAELSRRGLPHFHGDTPVHRHVVEPHIDRVTRDARSTARSRATTDLSRETD